MGCRSRGGAAHLGQRRRERVHRGRPRVRGRAARQAEAHVVRPPGRQERAAQLGPRLRGLGRAAPSARTRLCKRMHGQRGAAVARWRRAGGGRAFQRGHRGRQRRKAAVHVPCAPAQAPSLLGRALAAPNQSIWWRRRVFAGGGGRRARRPGGRQGRAAGLRCCKADRARAGGARAGAQQQAAADALQQRRVAAGPRLQRGTGRRGRQARPPLRRQQERDQRPGQRRRARPGAPGVCLGRSPRGRLPIAVAAGAGGDRAARVRQRGSQLPGFCLHACGSWCARAQLLQALQARGALAGRKTRQPDARRALACGPDALFSNPQQA